MRALACCLLLGLAACSPWPGPKDAPRWPEPVGLGTRITTGAPLRKTTLDFTAKSDRVYVMQRLAPGYAPDLHYAKDTDVTLFSFDPGSKEVRPLPPAPIDVQALEASEVPHGMLALSETEVATFDGASWTRWGPRPAGKLDFLYQADSQRLFARVGNTAWLGVGGEWKDLTAALPPGQRQGLVFGPWSPSAVRLVWTSPGTTQSQACTQLIDTSTLKAVGVPVCKDALATPGLLGDAINGTVDDFQTVFRVGEAVYGSALVWHFTNGGWVRGAFTQATNVRHTPGAPFLCVSGYLQGQGADLPSVLPIVKVEGGRPVETLFMPSASLTGCAGDERTCARNIDLTLQSVSRDCSTAWFLLDNFVDATRKVYLKSVDLPARDAVECTPACRTFEMCVAATDGGATCVADFSRSSTTSAAPASFQVRFTAPNGAPTWPELAFTDPATGAELPDFVAADVGNKQLVVSGTPNTPVKVTARMPGAAELSLTVEMPNENTRADLGTFALVGGLRLGRTPGGVPALQLTGLLYEASRTSVVLPVLGDDGGVALTQVFEASPGVLATEVLTSSDTQATAPVGSPDGKWVLWADRQGLEAWDVQARQRTTVSSGAQGPWNLSRAVFSRDGSTVAVPRGDPTGQVSLIDLRATPVERLVTPQQAWATGIQLSRDGQVMLFLSSQAWLLVTPSGTYPTAGGLNAFLSGDGSRVYFTDGTTASVTLTTQAAQPNATLAVVATGVSAVTVDGAGSDALFARMVAGKTDLFRTSGATGQVTSVLTGQAGMAQALPTDAIWIRDYTGTQLFFPFSAAKRVLSGLRKFVMTERGHLWDETSGLLVTETGSQAIPTGTGVFGADLNLRLDEQAGVIRTYSGATETGVHPYAGGQMATLSVDWRWNHLAQSGRFSLFAPCAVFSRPRERFTIAPSGGAVTRGPDGAEVYCAR